MDEKNQKYKKPIIIDSKGLSSEFTPIYNIAIGTDDMGFNPTEQVVLYKTSDEILFQSDLETAIQSGMQIVRRTKRYKLGKLLLQPLSLLLKKIK